MLIPPNRAEHYRYLANIIAASPRTIPPEKLETIIFTWRRISAPWLQPRELTTP